MASSKRIREAFESTFNHRYQGVLVNDEAGAAFYRHHLPDPVYFHKDIVVTLQQLGGGIKKDLLAAEKAAGPIRIVTSFMKNPPPNMPRHIKALDENVDLRDPRIGMGDWCNYERSGDDYAACAYFYLDNPENNLPALQPYEVRIAGVKQGGGAKRQD